MSEVTELARIAKALERIASALEKKPVAYPAPYVRDVPPYRPNPYWPHNQPVSWRVSDTTNGGSE